MRPYSRGLMAVHWLTAVVVVAAFTLGPGGSEQRVYSAAKDFDRQIHETLGLSVLALTLLRLAVWRAASHGFPPSAPRWMNLASRLVQLALYALLLAVPLTAIAGAWLEGHPLTLGILGDIAPPIAKDHALGASIAKVHTFLGDTILWVAGFHAAAALFHQFVLRDDVLLAMLPRWRAGRGR